MKIIEVVADAVHRDTLLNIARKHDVEDIWFGQVNEDKRVAARLLVSPEQRQLVLDALQVVLANSTNARIMIVPVEVSLLNKERDPESDAEKEKKSANISREEIFAVVEKGAKLDSTFLLLVCLSSIVAAIGLIENNIAVIIGAMVIAPLLGPNIAFSLGSSLGEKELIFKSLKTLSVGVILAIIIAVVLGSLWPYSMYSSELLSRTEVAYSSTAIALASGTAAVLSLVTGVSGVLVGVMVAVALMPPAVTIGLMLSLADWDNAMGAALLLMVNIVCINLSAKCVFLVRGIKPRTWLEAHQADQSRRLYFFIWIFLLISLFGIIYYRHGANLA